MSAAVSVDPRTGAEVAAPRESSADEIRDVIAAAAAVAPEVAATPPRIREAWLEALAAALVEHADELVALADQETALGEVRLRTELERTAANARYYGAVGARGDWMRAVRDDLDGVSLARAFLPIGVVGVFGASNFPFQFGVLGHDTCSAIAAGCPVVVKHHPAHPRLSARLGEVARAALADAGAPDGVFGEVIGFAAGVELVAADPVRAIGFTGSQRGGMALVETAAARTRPIPVYAEMGTVNPVLVTTRAAATRADDIAEGLVASFTLGGGQFCTKPGLVLLPEGSGLTERIAERVERAGGAWLLTAAIAQSFASGIDARVATGSEVLASGGRPDAGHAAAPTALRASIRDLSDGSPLIEECFGPLLIVVEYTDPAEARDALARLQPSLAAAVQTDGSGADPELEAVTPLLLDQVGRLVVDGWPTGVACSDAMQHGGPWPATSRPDATSVGAAALERWTRPVAVQGVPDAALPAPLRADDPWGVRP